MNKLLFSRIRAPSTIAFLSVIHCLGADNPIAHNMQCHICSEGYSMQKRCNLVIPISSHSIRRSSFHCSTLMNVKVEVEVTLRLTVSQSVSQYVLVSSTLVGLATRYYFLSECCCLNLRSCFCGAPSLMRGRVCNLQCNHYFTVSSETTPTWRARFPYLYPPRTGWPSYAPEHWVPFTSSLTTRLFRLAELLLAEYICYQHPKFVFRKGQDSTSVWGLTL
jgi:hypothetical protein